MRFLMTGASLLVFPLAFLLFAQWPLREWLQVGSREANDGGQIVFAVYVAVAVLAASRAGVHLSAKPAAALRRSESSWRAWAILLCVGPWAVFMLWSFWPAVVQSVVQQEHFAETLDSGYFVIKLAVALLLVLVLAQALRDVWRVARRSQ